MRDLHLRADASRRTGVKSFGVNSPGPDLATWSQCTGSRATVRVAGEVDLVTAPVLREALECARREVRTPCEHPELLVDLRGVSFLSAAGLGALAVLHLRCVDDGISMRVVGDQSAVRRPMELTGLEQLLADR